MDRLGRHELASAMGAVAEAHAKLAESRQQLLRWLAHETRVPLNSLYMGLQLVNGDASDVRRALPPSNEDLATLKLCGSAAEALISVLSDVLDIRCVLCADAFAIAF